MHYPTNAVSKCIIQIHYPLFIKQNTACKQDTQMRHAKFLVYKQKVMQKCNAFMAYKTCNATCCMFCLHLEIACIVFVL